jgi:hypothetical protein
MYPLPVDHDGSDGSLATLLNRSRLFVTDLPEIHRRRDRRTYGRFDGFITAQETPVWLRKPLRIGGQHASRSKSEAVTAQVWLSFNEIQQVFGCDTADARMRVVANQLERRRCTDGSVRAQVPSDVHRVKEEARRDRLAARLEWSKKYERKIKHVRREIGLSALERHSNKLGDRSYDLDGHILNTPATSTFRRKAVDRPERFARVWGFDPNAHDARAAAESAAARHHRQGAGRATLAPPSLLECI